MHHPNPGDHSVSRILAAEDPVKVPYEHKQFLASTTISSLTADLRCGKLSLLCLGTKDSRATNPNALWDIYLFRYE